MGGIYYKYGVAFITEMTHTIRRETERQNSEKAEAGRNEPGVHSVGFS
jgi:hypothetical protein